MIWTSYAGFEVKSSDSNVESRHARHGYEPGKMPMLRDASLLLLSDGIFLVVCDECGFNGITGKEPYTTPPGRPEDQKPIIKQADSVLSHKSATHWLKNGRKSLYTEQQIKVVIKVFLKWKSTRIRNWVQAACSELDGIGFTPYRGGKWNPGQLSGLVNLYIKRPEFANIKAGPMDEEDQAALAEMVRAAAERSQSGRGNHVGRTARITESKTRQPVDFAAIIAEQEAAKVAAAEIEVEAEVTASNTAQPTLTFPDRELPERTMELTVATPATVARKTTAAKATPAVQPSPVAQAPSDFEFVADVGGDPLFRYKGVLMIGKVVRGVDI